MLMSRCRFGLPGRRVLVAPLVVLVLLGGWLAFRGMQVRSGLLEARAGLIAAAGGLSGADVGSLAQVQRDASQEVQRARSAVDDPVWRAAALVPVAGRSFAVARETTLVASQLVDEVLPPLVRGGVELQEGALLRGGAVNLGLLDALLARVGEAETALVPAKARTAATSMSFLPPQVARAHGDLEAAVGRLSRGLASGRDGLELVPGLLGADGPRRYFLAVMNNAEVRGPGGLVGAYAVLRADRGRLELEKVGTNQDFRTADAPVVDLGPEFAARYDQEFARSFWSAAVLTPHWPSASRIMAGLWQEQGGGVVDGVLGVDPLAMAGILAVTGPAQVSGRTIGAANVADFVMRDEYAVFAEDSERKEVLSDLAAGLYTKVASGGYSAPAMLAALGRAAGTGHLQVWAAREAEQSALEKTRAAGDLPGRPGAYLQVVSNNAAGNKADYYVRRRVGYERTAPGQALVTVQLRNTVVAAAVPPVVIGRLDEPAYAVEPGQTRQLLSVYVGVGQVVRRVLVDGVEVAADLGTEQGHGVATLLVEVRPSRATLVTAEVTDPGGELLYRQQPLVVDDELDLDVSYEVG